MAPDPHMVLFVDDEIEILKALKRAMQSEPYPCLFADSGRKAIEFLASQPVAVMVSDMRMPHIDGPELLKHVTLHHPATIRLVLSSWANSEDILEAINCGHIYRYIVKPWDNRELITTVQQAMALYGLQLEKQRLLEQLEAQNVRLEQQVASRTQQLLKISNHAEIGKYASQIVHNLNNPLQVLFGVLGLARKKLLQDEGGDQTPLAGYIDIAQQSAKDLHQIVTGILMHARDDQHQTAVPIDINEVIRHELIFFDIEPSFKNEIEKKIELEIDLPTVLGNSIQIKQMVDNLIRNAVDAMAESPIKQLHLRTAHHNHRVIIEVGDTGEGISSQDLPLIFNPDFTTKPMDKGTGLGLASVQTMVTSYGGDIRVASEKGQGATFIIRIPIKHDIAGRG
jgi:signal transduction histidine kinase